VEKAALVWLAARLARGNRSAFLASLIVKAAREEIGRDWEAVVTGASVEAEAA
jgi:replication-associated recombination protein RarA